jgi:predicted kinase
MDIKQKFIHWYFDDFRHDPMFIAMSETSEDSPWHRECDVGVHTDMVVAEYLSRSIPFDIRGAIGCAFHDIGKPPAEQIKFREDRGEYRAYHGHELVSARMWEDWAVRNWKFLEEEFLLTSMDIYTIGWMIEHHVPWGTKKDDKLNAFARTAYKTLSDSNAWPSMLLADQYGRISDDSHQRGEEAQAWVDDHQDRKYRAAYAWTPYTDKRVFMLIGPPGAGKSTFRKTLEATHKGAAVVSMDDLRLEWYGGPYDNAFAKASKDSKFNAKVDKHYIETLRENDVVILDNTNTSAKARKRWMAPARARDFQLIAVLFPSTLQQVKDRQKTRGDKEIPLHVVENMYNRLSLPMFGDFDDILVVDGNLPS